jgi:hypothetical protein
MFIGKQRSGLRLLFITLSLASCTGRIEQAYVTETALPPGQGTAAPTSIIVDFTPTPPVPELTPTFPILSDTPIPTEGSPLTQLPACEDAADVELLSSPLTLSAPGGNSAEPPPPYQALRPDALQGKDTLKVVVDIHGKTYGVGARYDESAIIIDQPGGSWKVVSIAWYKNDKGKDVNGVNGKQTFYVPLTDFIGLDDKGNLNNTSLNLASPAGPLHFRFWNLNDFVVDIYSVVACNSQIGQ